MMRLRCVSLFKIIIAASLALSAMGCSKPSKPPPDIVGTYFRMKVHLTYKGKPVDIDFVGGCGTRYINYAYGGTTEEPVSMSAAVFGAKMPEGHAVTIKTYDERFKSPCEGGTTANGDFEKDWLPLIVWYERDDEFAHGIGYVTQDAYENPNAKFGFRSATVEHATKEEFEAFMRNGPHNLLPSHLTDWLTHLDAPDFKSVQDVKPDYIKNPAKAWTYADRPICRSVRKVPLTAAQRDQVRRMWPSDHPNYWAPPGDNSALEFRLLTDDQRVRDVATFTTPRTDEDRAETAKIYPVKAEEGLGYLSPQTGKGGQYVHDILIGDGVQNLGFTYCDSPAPWMLEGAVTGHVPNPAERGSHLQCRLGTLIVPVDDGVSCDQGNWIAFERDEYAIVSENTVID
jgi:hypothetical protein